MRLFKELFYFRKVELGMKRVRDNKPALIIGRQDNGPTPKKPPFLIRNSFLSNSLNPISKLFISKKFHKNQPFPGVDHFPITKTFC